MEEIRFVKYVPILLISLAISLVSACDNDTDNMTKETEPHLSADNLQGRWLLEIDGSPENRQAGMTITFSNSDALSDPDADENIALYAMDIELEGRTIRRCTAKKSAGKGDYIDVSCQIHDDVLEIALGADKGGQMVASLKKNSHSRDMTGNVKLHHPALPVASPVIGKARLQPMAR